MNANPTNRSKSRTDPEPKKRSSKKNQLSTNSQTASIYDFPVYYDLIFGSDWAAEFKFLGEVFDRHVTKKTNRLFEPACGTGRLMYRFAKADYVCDGIDLNAAAVDYCNKRMHRNKLGSKAWVADMSDFSVKKKYDAAFNTINSFRHLSTESSARSHLQCMARAIRKGGIYALGLHLTPLAGDATDHESWSARRGNLVVNTSMWPKSKNSRKRIEEFHMRFDVHKPTGTTTINDVLVLRSYNHKQMSKLIGSVPDWSVEAVYDFRYSIDDPIEVDQFSEDVVYILKRI